MLYVVGLGLGDERDITVRGLDIVRSCDQVYLESYTSILSVNAERLEEMYGKPITLLHREDVESGIETVLQEAEKNKVAFLVVGDPFSATTHSDIVIRAKSRGISVQTVFNTSIITAVGECGLQLYRFGQAVSLVLWTDTWKPDSYYDKVLENRKLGLHTLCLLDIRMRERTVENIIRDKKIYEPPTFMTSSVAASQLLEIEEKRGENVFDKNTLCVAFARMGTSDQKIVVGTMERISETDMGAALHTLVICGDLHVMECELLLFYVPSDDQTTRRVIEETMSRKS